MEEEVEIICSYCSTKLYLSVPSLEEKIKKANIGRVGRVVHQLLAKQGPYYDRWKAAMDARGEQKRCKECRWFMWKLKDGTILPVLSQKCKTNPGRFACKWFKVREEAR